MQGTDRAKSFFIRGGDIWVRMRSGREIRLGPFREVSDSMRDYVAEPNPIRKFLRTWAS